jgi:hypothetical protein
MKTPADPQVHSDNSEQSPEDGITDLSLGDLFTFRGEVERLRGEPFEERKSRPCVLLFRAGELCKSHIAAPMYGSNQEGWRSSGGRPVIVASSLLVAKHIGMNRQDFVALGRKERNALIARNKIDTSCMNNLLCDSQLGLDNAFYLGKIRFRRFGKIDNIDLEIARGCLRLFIQLP